MAMARPLFDPKQIPVAGMAGEPPLPAERMTPAWLRERFANPPHWSPELAGDSAPGNPGAKPASVLIPLVERRHLDGERKGEAFLSVLLTQRTAHLKDHAGQISFPGGRAEDYDASPVDTALRETEEEIGLHRRYVDVIGILPEYMTITGYRVTPVVGIVTPPFELSPDANEVAEAFEVPLSFLMDGSNHERRGFTGRHFYAMPYADYFIWGATAAMLRNLYHFLRA
jgi:8-oxo-dGTP pyrophosphatase MutT (NUDIX family)